jgi:hypothetical protein
VCAVQEDRLQMALSQRVIEGAEPDLLKMFYVLRMKRGDPIPKRLDKV